jgi:hypothetical protein
MRLFLVRALEALRPSGHERLVFCFGTGERNLVKALEVQSLLGDLRLALEAMLPGFNRYDGAEAIGARSDLYVCRPAKGARVGESARGRSRKASGSRIYTRGPSAQEAALRPLPAAVVDVALPAVGDNPVRLVGDGWPVPAAPGPPVVTLAEFFARTAAWATSARPGPAPLLGTPVVNTYPDHGGAALRTLLLAAPERAVFVVPRRELAGFGLLAAAYDVIRLPAGPGGDPAVLLAARHDRPPAGPGEAVLRHLFLHPGAKVGNAWRDALLAASRDAGAPMTKNEARARVAAACPPGPLGLRSWELPLGDLGRLVTAVLQHGGPGPDGTGGPAT